MAHEDLPTVSVILTVKQMGVEYLEESLGSVVGQVYRPLEILVFDGALTEGTPEIANSFCSVRYFRNDSALPIAASRNIGISVAKGDLIAFASHDDVWNPEKLWIQAESFKRDPQLEFCLSHIRYFLDDGATSVPAGLPADLIERDLPGWLPETLVARRGTFERVGQFDESLQVTEYSDWLLRARNSGARWMMREEALVRKRLYAGEATDRREPNVPDEEEMLERAPARDVASWV